MRNLLFFSVCAVTLVLLITCNAGTAEADLISDETLLTDTESLPPWLRDRGEGVPASMFGTYVTRGQVLVYPFFEYYHDSDMEYSPDELGHVQVHDYRGSYRASEGLIYLGYGISDRMMIEIEAAGISAKLEKADDDNSTMPDELEESGLGDVEGQLRWRWNREAESAPEVFNYFEVVFPLQKDKVLIGTPDWEYKLGIGAVKGFSFGTMTVRTAVEYDRSEDEYALGEYAVEYLRKLSTRWRVFCGVEGDQDEVELITEAQLHLSRNLFCKFNNAFGATSKATDWAPEVGIVFSF